MGAEIEGEFLDNEIGHEKVNLQGDQYMMAKLLILMGKRHYFRVKSQIADYITKI